MKAFCDDVGLIELVVFSFSSFVAAENVVNAKNVQCLAAQSSGPVYN